MVEHEESDRREFAALRAVTDGLATKKDTKEILSAIKTVHIGFGFVKFGWRTFLTVGAVAGAVVALVTFWKFFVGWIVGMVVTQK